MFNRFFSAFSRGSTSEPVGSVPDGARIYAMGDIHGRLDLLDELLRRIDADDSGRPEAETTLICLGDLIDRGPESAQVVERLYQLSQRAPGMRFLLGNHEEVFLKAMAGEKGALPFFLRIGGRETVLSYGISREEYDRCDYDELYALLLERVPPHHVSFIEGFEDLIEFGDYAFVHAGIRPGVPLAEQSRETLRWIRQEFLEHRGPLEKIVVHGHTISSDVELRRWRIGLDTGAFSSGRLTAMGFEGDRRWTLQTGAAVDPA